MWITSRLVTGCNITLLTSYLADHNPMQSGIGIDIEVRHTGIGNVVICKLAVEARAASDDTLTLIEIQDAGHVGTRRVGTSPIERNDQRNRHTHLAEIRSHHHHGVGAQRMAYQHDGAAPTGLVVGSNVVRY